LLQHISDPARGLSYQHTKRQRLGELPSCFVSHQLVTNLGTVTVNNGDTPSLLRQLDDRCDTLAGAAELVGDGRGLAGPRQRVAAER
jgi:hypothetical protein